MAISMRLDAQGSLLLHHHAEAVIEPLDIPCLRQVIQVVLAHQSCTAVPGDRGPCNAAHGGCRAGEEGIEGDREIDTLVEAALTELFRRDVGAGSPGAHGHAVGEPAGQIQGAAIVACQIPPGTGAYQNIPERRLVVGGNVPGPGRIIAEAEVLTETALLDPVGIHTDGPAGVEGTIEHLTTHTTEHVLQQAAVGHGVDVAVQLAGPGVLQVLQHHIRGGQILTDMSTHLGQLAHAFEFELVPVVEQVDAQVAADPAVAGKTVLGVHPSQELIEDEPIRAAHVLLVAQVQAPVELVQLGGMQHVLVHHARCCVDDAAAQILLITTMILVVAQRLSPDTGLADRHAARFVHQGVPVVRTLTQAVIQNARGPGNPFRLVAVGGLLTGYYHFPVADGDVFNREPGVIPQAVADVSPVHLLAADARGQGATALRLGVQELAWEGIRQVGTEGNADHGSVAAFPAGCDIDAVADTEHCTEVDPRIRRLEVRITGLRAIVVAIQLQLQAEAIPRRLVFHTAEDGRRPAEIGRGVEVTAAITHFTASPILIAQPAEGVAHVCPVTQVTPADTEAEVQIMEALAGYQVFAGEQAGTTHVYKAQRNLWQPAGFLIQAQLGVYRLVLVALVAAELAVLATISEVGHRGIPQRALKPWQGRYRNAVTAVGRNPRGVEAEGAFLGKTRSRGLQQAHAAVVGLGGAIAVCRSLGSGNGESQQGRGKQGGMSKHGFTH